MEPSVIVWTVLVIMVKIVFETWKSEAYTVSVKPEYIFGEIMEIYFLYEPEFEDHENDTILSIIQNVTALHGCTIPPNRGRKIADHRSKLQPFVRPSVKDVYFQIIEMPTDFIEGFRYSNETPWTLKVTVETLNTSSRALRFFDLTDAAVDDWIFDTLIHISDERRKENAAKINETAPSFSVASELDIDISPLNSSFEYPRMQLHKVDRGREDFCPTDNTVGEIDLEAYHNLESPSQCEVSMNRTTLNILNFMFPHGLIRVRFAIEQNDKVVYDLRRYFEVTYGRNTFPFNKNTTPSADSLFLPIGADIHVDLSNSYFPFRHPSYGTVQQFLPKVEIKAICLGTFQGFCTNWSKLLQHPRLTIKWADLEEDFVYFNILSLFFFIFYDGGPKHSAQIRKIFNFQSNTLRADIICIRNCGDTYSPMYAGIWMGKCYDCEGDDGVDPWNIRYSWGDVGQVKGIESRYFTLPEGSTTKPFSLQLKVTCPKIILSNVTGELYVKQLYKTVVRKRIRVFSPGIAAAYRPRMQSLPEARAVESFDIFLRPDYKRFRSSAVPLNRFYRDDAASYANRAHYCSYVSPIHNVALTHMRYAPSVVGFQGADGTLTKNHLNVVKQPNPRMVAPLGDRCRMAVSTSAYGLSSLMAIAIEIDKGGYRRADVDECFLVFKPYITGPTLKKSRLTTSYKIQVQMIRGSITSYSSNDIYYRLKLLEDTRDRILSELLLPYWELEAITWHIFEVLFKVFDNPPPLVYPETAAFQTSTRNHITRNAMAFLQLWVEREKIYEINHNQTALYMWWADFSFNGTSTHLSKSFGSRDSSIHIPWEAVVDGLSFYGPEHPKIQREDNLINALVLMTKRMVFDPDPRVRLSYGMVDVHFEMKTTQKEMILRPPKNSPIVVSFKKGRSKGTDGNSKGMDMFMEIVEKNGQVLDATCIIFGVARSTSYNMTLGIDLEGDYNYTFGVVEAKYPSEYLSFIGMKFKNVKDTISYSMPKASKRYRYLYPLSRFLFMVRIATADGTAFGVSGGKKTKPKKPSVDTEDFDWRLKLSQPYSEEVVFEDLTMPGDNNTVDDQGRKLITLNVKVHRSDCYYLIKSNWRNDEKCLSVPAADPDVVECHCYVDATYSAKRSLAQKQLRDFQPRVLDYHGPTVLPGFFICICFIVAVFYCYWAFFQDVQEKECAQIHVVKNMFHPDSPEQYLVCICTGTLPGSGTTNRVSFLLVGESGSFKTVETEGKFVFSTGSEIWFLLSSDLVLGHLAGVTVNYDKITCGTNLYPWFLKRVVVYSKRFNHVIEFEANQTLGIHLRSLVLPTVPRKPKRFGELLNRFWHIMKDYHIIGTVIWHVPGKGVTRWQSALGSVTVVMASAALAIELLGPPTPVYHLNVLSRLSLYGYIMKTLNLSGITFCMAMIIKLTYALIFRRKIGVIWYHRLQEQDVWWKGPPKNKEVVETWLTNKRALPEEPEVNPKWLIRRMYFPAWVARRLAKAAARKERKQREKEEARAAKAEKEAKAASKSGKKGAKGKGAEKSGSAKTEAKKEPKKGVEAGTGKPEAGAAAAGKKQRDEAAASTVGPSSEVDPKGGDQDTLQFGVGRGVRRPSQVSQLSGASRGRRSTDSRAPSEASFHSYSIKKRKVGSFVVSEEQSGTGETGKSTGESAQFAKHQLARSSGESTMTKDDRNKRTFRDTNINRDDSDCDDSEGNEKRNTEEKEQDKRQSHAEITDSIQKRSTSREASIKNLPTSEISEPSEITFPPKQDPLESPGYKLRRRLNLRVMPDDEEWTASEESDKQSTDTKRYKYFKGKKESEQTSLLHVRSPFSSNESDQYACQTTVADNEHRLLSGAREDSLAEDLVTSSETELTQDLTSLQQSDESLVTSFSEKSIIIPEQKEAKPLVTKTRFDLPPKAVSFRHYYFRPIVVKGPKPGQWYKASDVHSDIRFLRDSRYLEKLARDYKLDPIISQPRAVFAGHSTVCRRKYILKSKKGKIVSKCLCEHRDGMCVDDKYWFFRTPEEPRNSFLETEDGTCPTTDPYSSIISKQTLLTKDERYASATTLPRPRRLRKIVSIWTAVKRFFTGSLSRLPARLRRSMMGARKESTPDLCISARQNSVTEPCATLSDASLLQHSVSGFSGVSSGLPDLSSLSSQQCQGHNRTTVFDGRPSRKIQAPEADDQQNGRTSQSLRVQYDKNRSAQPSAESDMPGMLGEEDADTGVDNEDVESVGETDLDNLLKGETDLDYPGPPPDTTAPGHIRLIGSSVDESKPVDRPRESERRSILEKKKETTLYSVIVYIIYRFFDTLLSVWSLKSEITKLFIILICVSVSIFCCYWVCVNGVYYSFHQGLEWFLVLMTVLILEVTVFEPAAFMACALMGMQIWKKPLIINECLKRFKIVMDDLFFRDWMTYIEVANRQITSPVHQQAAPESASLFHLHDKIYAALKKHVIAPDVVFHTGVYWLIIYTACTIVLVNIQTDITNANMQATHIAQALGLEDAEYEKPIDVDGMWDYINNKLRTGLIYMEAHLNESVLPWRQLNASRTSLGSMLITPVRLKQIRVQPYRLLLCSPLYKTVEIDLMRQCNFELNKDNIDTSDYGFSWTDYEQTGFDNRYSNRPDGSNIFATIDLVPPYGYTSVVYFDQITTLFSLQEIQDSDWIDEHTRILVVDFSLVNVYSHIVSSYRILFDFKRSSPFWSAISFHFRFEDPSNMKYFMIFWGIIFLNISAYNIIKEMMLVHKMGILNYLSELASYTEILKVLLSLVLCYVYFRKIDLRGEILNDLEDSYRFREKNKFVDFFEMAMLDYVYAITGGFLAFVCIFQIFVMLSKIRRLLVFLRLLISCVTLFYMPLATATAFAFLSHMLFGKTNENFSSLPISYLMINQYFIKPRAIYEALTDNHPYIGPFFYFLLGFCINFFMVNFFIVFLNEAYSSIQNQVRIESYKVREKTRLEYVYEFLGISSTITWDIADDEMLKERARDRDYLKDIKSLKAL